MINLPFLLIASLATVTPAVAGPCSNSKGIADPSAVTQSFKKALIAPGVILKKKPLHPTVDVQAVYGDKAVNQGNVFTITETTPAPTISFTREEDYPPSTNYTVMILDPDAPMPRKPKSKPGLLAFFLHTLETNVHPTCAKKLAGSEDTIASYLSPTPLSVARHRYIFLVWRQPPGTIEYTTQPAFTARNNFNLTEFVKETGIELVGGNFFVEGAGNV